MQFNLDLTYYTTGMIGPKLHTSPTLYQLFMFVGGNFPDLIFLFCILECVNFQTVYLSLAKKRNMSAPPRMNKWSESSQRIDMSNSANVSWYGQFCYCVIFSVKMAIIPCSRFLGDRVASTGSSFQTYDIFDPPSNSTATPTACTIVYIVGDAHISTDIS